MSALRMNFRAVAVVVFALVCVKSSQARAADLWVGTNGSSGVIGKYDADTGALESIVVPHGGHTNIIEGLTFGPDGNLYVSNYDNGFGAVQKYSSDGTYLGDFTPVMPEPGASAFGPDGNLYVVSFTGNFVARFNGTTGAFIDDFVPAGLGVSALLTGSHSALMATSMWAAPAPAPFFGTVLLMARSWGSSRP